MADRITQKHLEALVARINTVTDSPMAYMDADRKILVGHYHIDYAYGGVSLARTMTTGGGINAPLGSYHRTKRELYDQMQAFLAGIDAKS